MVLGNLSWDSAKLGISAHSNSVMDVKLSEQQLFHNEGVEKMLSLPPNERLDPEGYLTNTPAEVGEKDFIHAVAYTTDQRNEDWDGTEPIKIEYDARWTELCASNWNWNTAGRTSKDVRDNKITGLGAIRSDCMSGSGEGTKHYWVDKTQGPFTVGCSDEDADNYTTDADYKDDEVCTYSCSDPNRTTTAEGKCGDTCVEGYGFNQDRVCQEGISARFVGGIKSLPWVWIGGGFVLIIAGKIFMSRKK